MMKSSLFQRSLRIDNVNVKIRTQYNEIKLYTVIFLCSFISGTVARSQSTETTTKMSDFRPILDFVFVRKSVFANVRIIQYKL